MLEAPVPMRRRCDARDVAVRSLPADPWSHVTPAHDVQSPQALCGTPLFGAGRQDVDREGFRRHAACCL